MEADLLIREKLNEINAQALACQGDGSAAKEWEDAREMPLEAVHSIIHECFPDDGSGVFPMTGCAAMIMAFRWGYEVAVAKEREGFIA